MIILAIIGSFCGLRIRIRVTQKDQIRPDPDLPHLSIEFYQYICIADNLKLGLERSSVVKPKTLETPN